MLTKDQLKFHRRAGVIKPVFLNPEDSKVLAVATTLLDSFEECFGLKISELEEMLNGTNYLAPYAAGLKKLLLDRLEFNEDDETVGEHRWDLIQAAQGIRKQSDVHSYEDFLDKMSAKFDKKFDDISDGLYADLPTQKTIKRFKDISSENLVHRYNVAQIQGLLLRANDLTIKIKDLDLSERRALFLNLRFHRLLADIRNDEKNKTIEIILSGPLSLFQSAQTYGIRLANFFPHLLNVSTWKLEANINIKNFDLVLKLDQKCKIKSHYNKKTPYIPEELSLCVDGLKKIDRAISAKAAEVILNLGGQNIVIPDIEITKASKSIYVELFHKWHVGQLKKRLSEIDSNDKNCVILGVCSKLAKSKEMKPLLEESKYFAEFGLIYNDFPTAKKLYSVVNKHL